jgi:N4-gp56 family major capsid protein
MTNEITGNTSTLSYDREKFLAAQLVSRSQIRMVAASLCDKITMKEGAGETAYFVRYSRMNLPTTALSDDGADPANSTFSLEEFSVSLDEWGDQITITTRAGLNTKHPLLQEAMNLLADNAARVMDREIQLVWLAGTNVRYGDGSVASRVTITNTMKLDENVIGGARVQLVTDGAPPKGMKSKDAFQTNASGTFMGGGSYVAVAGPQVLQDLARPSVSLGTWVGVAQYANAKALFNFEVGTWMNMRWVESNFLPAFTTLGNSTVIVASGGSGGITGFTVTAVSSGGSLVSAGVYAWKLVRKSLSRGFGEAISITHTTTPGGSGDNEGLDFVMPSTAGYVYDLYFDATAGGGTTDDSNLKLVSAGIAASGTVHVLAAQATGAAPPGSLRSVGDGADPTTVYPVFIHADESCKWVGFYNTRFYITKDESIIGNVTRRKRAIAYTFFGKAKICDQTRLLRLEVASTF